jgi:hypothetical protein
MKRDMDLVRQILLIVEEHQGFDHPFKVPLIEGFTRKEIDYHVLIMAEADLLDAVGLRIVVQPTRLTWQGHEFLETIREEERWRQVKGVLKQVQSSAFEVVKAVGVQIAINSAMQLLQ